MQPEEAATRMLDIFTVILRQKDGPHGLQIDGTDPDCALVRAIKDACLQVCIGSVMSLVVSDEESKSLLCYDSY